MAYARGELTGQMRAAIGVAFGIAVATPAVQLHGGEDSTAYRIGDLVVRLGPAWRSDEQLRWGTALAAHAGSRVPEVATPVPAVNGELVVRVADRPVTVWPFVPGSWPARGENDLPARAAELLVRLHDALSTAPAMLGRSRSVTVPDPDLDDRDLDAFLHNDTDHPAQPLHGDYYRGNLLAVDGVITGLLDWDEAFTGPVAAEVAVAAWEWGDCLNAGTMTGAYRFAAEYAAAGGLRVDRATIRQYARERMRWEIMRARGAWDTLDADDHRYHRLQEAAFHRLRPRRPHG